MGLNQVHHEQAFIWQVLPIIFSQLAHLTFVL